MKIRITFINLFLFITSCACIRTQNNQTDLIEKAVSDLLSEHSFSGAIVIGTKGEIIFSKGYGYSSIQDSIPFTPSTPSDGGSVAKTMTAAIMLNLQRNGKLLLSDPVQQYLPDYPYDLTTLQHLITHSTGGLPDYDYFFSLIPDSIIIDNQLILELIEENRPNLPYPPGTNFRYDNTGFDLAALIAEQVTGDSFGQILRKTIFLPLNMETSFIRQARISDWTDSRAIGYRSDNGSVKLFDIEDREGFYGGSNVWISALDLYTWSTGFYDHSVFDLFLLDELLQPVFIDGKQSLIVQGSWYQGRHNDAYYYWGNVAGFYSFVYWDRLHEFTIAFVSNSNMPHSLRPLFTGSLVGIMENSAYPIHSNPHRNTISPDDSDQLTGNFIIEGIGEINITKQGPELHMQFTNNLNYAMYRTDESTIYVPGVDCWLTFDEISKNRFQKMHWSSTNVNTIGYRIMSDTGTNM
jgi:CubicO group peptidase (beta-lactamase class C family)